MKINDYIELNCMDCMDLMKKYPDNYFDLAVVDVPYGIGEDGRKTKGRTFRADGSARKTTDKRTGRKAIIYTKHNPKKWDESHPKQSYFDELFRIAKKHIIFGCNYINFDQKKTSTGRIFWDKVNGNNDFSDGELIWTNLFSSVRQIEYMWNGMLQGKSIKEGRINQGNKAKCEKRIHPTQKPVILYEKLLTDYAKTGYKIVDTHKGSGSIVIAVDKLNKLDKMDLSIVCSENDPEMFEKAVKRIKNETIQQTLF